MTGSSFDQPQIDGDNIDGAGKSDQRIRLFGYLKIFAVISGAKATFIVLYSHISIGELPFQTQGVMRLHIGATGILHPLSRPHTGIHAVIYFAEGVYRHKKRITAKFNMIQRITKQLLLICYRVLLPFALQVALPRRLYVGVEPAGGAES